MEPLVNRVYDAIEYEKKNSNKLEVCGICGENHSPKECNILKITNHIPDKVIPSKARLTLPEALEIRKLSDSSYNVYAQCLIQRGTQFGPFQAKKLFTLHPSIEFALKIFTDIDEDLSEYFLDTSDENECSWMIFIGPAASFQEQNIICYQEGEHLYYGTIREIHPGEPLKVWYSPYYATKMKREVLNPENCQENMTERGIVDVETILKRNKNIMPRDSWSCKFCGKVEKELSVFAFHLLDHYRAQMSRVCTICKESFLSRQNLNKHLRIVHGSTPKKNIESVTDIQVSPPKDTSDSKEASSVGGPLLLNDIIPDSLDNSSLFLPQTDISHFDLSSIENQNIMLENENLNLNMDNILTENVKGLDHFNFDIKEPEIEQLVCDICLKSFLKLKSLIQHIEQHTGKYLCYECNRVFARKENLVYHSCKSFYKLKCPLCDRIFFQKKYLSQHIKVFHNKQFTCDKCHKFYDSRKHLQTHNCSKVPLSKKEKFPCNVCSKIFFQKRNLDEHLARHITPKVNQQYVCAVCNKILQSKSSYLKHAKLHEGLLYPCDICDKEFRRTDSLKLHREQVHLNEGEMETCEICEKKLKSKKLLQIHKETHRSDKPFKCLICQATFKHRSNLTRHSNMHKRFQAKFESFFQDRLEIYHCAKCDKNMKLKSSLQRHMRVFHPDDELTLECLKPKMARLSTRNKDVSDEESDMDLKQTIENMNFTTDEVNNCSENDINMELDKILNNTDNMDTFLNESSDRIVESLINIATKENQLDTVNSHYIAKEVCLSMPDLSENDQDIKLGSSKNMRYLRFNE